MSLNGGDSARRWRVWRNGAPRTGVKGEKMGGGRKVSGNGSFSPPPIFSPLVSHGGAHHSAEAVRQGGIPNSPVCAFPRARPILPSPAPLTGCGGWRDVLLRTPSLPTAALRKPQYAKIRNTTTYFTGIFGTELRKVSSQSL